VTFSKKPAVVKESAFFSDLKFC